MITKVDLFTNVEGLDVSPTIANAMLPAGFRVLVACEESQTVCKAFRNIGVEAYSCDLQECSGGYPEWHIQGNAIVEAYSGKYDLMIAHPPCTYLSKAGARWLYSGGKLNALRYEQGLYAKAFFEAMLNAPIKHIAVENPTPMKIFNLPPHSQRIEPYAFGHKYSKRTLLWLKNLPLLKATKFESDYVPYLPSNTGGAKRGQKATPKSISQKESSKTFEGVANAMAVQWMNAVAACR
jgi:hypothetical protein